MAGGGTWLSENKTRAGAYINFKAVDKSSMTVGDRGIAAIGLPLKWGAERSVIPVLSSDLLDGTSNKLIGYDATNLEESKYLRAILSYCYKALVFNLNSGGAKAKTTIKSSGGTVGVEAAYAGSYGNKIIIAVEIESNSTQTVYTYVDGEVKDEQQILTLSDLSDNDYVTFTYSDGAESLVADAGTALSGGEDGTVSDAAYTAMIAAFKKEKWQTYIHLVNEGASKKLICDTIKDLRENEGVYVQAVIPDYDGADYEGIITVANGVTVDGEDFEAYEATCIVGGMTAGANCNQSNTARKVDGATAIIGEMTNSEIIAALKKGKFLFSSSSDGTIMVEKDINSLHTYSQDRDYSYSKNRVIRVLDEIGTQTKITWETSYMGKVDNNSTGRSIFKSDLVQYANELQRISAIQEFDGASDITIKQGSDLDTVIVDWNVKPVDAMERLYLTCYTRT